MQDVCKFWRQIAIQDAVLIVPDLQTAFSRCRKVLLQQSDDLGECHRFISSDEFPDYSSEVTNREALLPVGRLLLRRLAG